MANSRKHGERCIAGIDVDTGRWVRPVTATADGKVPFATRRIGDAEPALLDILAIPLKPDGPDFGFESENRLIRPGHWQRDGSVSSADLTRFCDDHHFILHTQGPSVPLAELQRLPPVMRRTLQLVEVRQPRAYVREAGTSGRRQWRAVIANRFGQRLDVPITDPVALQTLDAGGTLASRCLVTVSLGMPLATATAGDPCCWKLIAGIIPLPTSP